jgi:hypothetical protein
MADVGGDGVTTVVLETVIRVRILSATGSEEAVDAAAVSAEPQMAVNETDEARGEIANKPRVIFFMSLRF